MKNQSVMRHMDEGAPKQACGYVMTPPEADSAPSRRVNDIEGIRGILAVLVIIVHLDFLGTAAGHWFGDAFCWVWICMDMFFCMSGYLIGSQILNNNHSQMFWRVYLQRRALRIWPVYFASLFVGGFAEVMICHLKHEPSFLSQSGSWWSYLFFLQNVSAYFPPHQHPVIGSGFFAHSWSVAIEEQFYLVVPLYILGLQAAARIPNHYLRAWAISLFFVIPVLGSLYLRFSGIFWQLFGTRSDAFVAGIVVAWMKHRTAGSPANTDAIRRSVRRVLPLALAAIPPFLGIEIFEETNVGQTGIQTSAAPGISLAALISALIVAACVFEASPRLSRFLRIGLLVRLGKMSYSTYMWHFPIVILLALPMDRDEMPFFVRIGVVLFTIYSISYFSYRYIEKPLETKKLRFVPSPMSPVIPPQTSARGVPSGPELGDATGNLVSAKDFPILP